MICPVAHESEAGACTCNSSHTTAGHGLHRCIGNLWRVPWCSVHKAHVVFAVCVALRARS